MPAGRSVTDRAAGFYPFPPAVSVLEEPHVMTSSVLIETFETPQAQPFASPWTLAVNDFVERAALALFPGRRPYQRPDLAGTVLRARMERVGWHGGSADLFDAQWVMPGQSVIEVPDVEWPAARPEDCTIENRRAAWFGAEGQQMSESEVLDLRLPEPVVLLCLNCGLDLG